MLVYAYAYALVKTRSGHTESSKFTCALHCTGAVRMDSFIVSGSDALVRADTVIITVN